MGLTLEHRPVEALIPYARNSRTNSEDQVALIAGSVREFGFANPEGTEKRSAGVPSRSR